MKMVTSGVVKTFLIFMWLSLSLIASTSSNDFDPYKELGLSRGSQEREIRNAYRKLAKTWHPDKNKSPEASDKFMKINRAYEILNDPDRKSHYDQFGTIYDDRGDGNNYGHHRGHGHFHDQYRHFEEFFSDFHFGGNFKQNFQNSPEETVNRRIYENNIYPNSDHKPFFIFAYAEFCYACARVAPIWSEFKQELTGIGIGAGNLDAMWNQDFARNLGIEVGRPAILAVINYKIYHFNNDFSVKNLREFARSIFPSDLASNFELNKINQTLKWNSAMNKVTAVFISSNEFPSLKYQTPCMQYRENVKCYYIPHSKVENVKEFESTLRISPMNRRDTLIIFKEILDVQEVIQSDKLSYQSIANAFKENKNLAVPRIISSSLFSDLCPIWSSNSNPKLCVVFIVNSELELSPETYTHIETDEFMKNNLQITYITKNTQSEFFRALVNTKANTEESSYDHKLVILRRLDDNLIQFNWLEPNFLEKPEKMIITYVVSILKNFNLLKFKTRIPKINDEIKESFFSTIYEIIDRMWNYTTQRVLWTRMVLENSYILGILFILSLLYIMQAMTAEPESANTNNTKRRNNESNSRNAPRETNRSDTSFSEADNSFQVNTLCPELNETDFKELKRKNKNFLVLFLCYDKDMKLLKPVFEDISKSYKKKYELTFFHLNFDTDYSEFRSKMLSTVITSTKLDLVKESERGLIAITFNLKRSFFSLFKSKFKYSEINEGLGECFGLDSESDLIKTELSMWLDKLTEGLWIDKYYIEE